MSGGVRRALADLACRVLLATLPASLRGWGWAIRHETAAIADDGKALLFALGGLCGLLPRAIASHLIRPFAWLIGDGGIHTGDSIMTNIIGAAMRRPRALGILCAGGAVALGLAYMAIAGAPARHLLVNIGALAIGLAALALLGRAKASRPPWTGAAIAVMAAGLLATALFGDEADGAARWVKLGGFALQPSLILLPAMLVAFSRTRNAVATLGIVAAVAAMALQPDRAMAAMLAFGLSVLAIMRPGRHFLAASVVGVAGLAATLVRADTLPATPYVDRIFYTSFDVHPLAGMAVLGGSALLLMPAIVGWVHDPAHRPVYAMFGTAWFVAMMAAALGNYPTPIVGYGGSAIIGYALSLLALPKMAETQAEVASPVPAAADSHPADRHLRVGMA